MKKVFQKNQIAITALAIMIAVAGYLNFTEQNASKDGNQKSGSSVETIDTMDISDGDSLIKEKAESSQNAAEKNSDEVSEESQTAGSTETIGGAVLTQAQVSEYVAGARMEREQTHSKTKESLNEIINSDSVGESAKKEAVDKLAELADIMEKEAATEQLLASKGFENAVVSIGKETLPEIAHEINIVNLTSEEQNRGLLDPYVIMENPKDSESLAIDILTFLTGISSRDGEKFPVLRKAIRAVTNSEERGLFKVIEELRAEGTTISTSIADHIESFTDYDFAHLLFSDGDVTQSISLEKQLNIIQVADLVLPDKETSFEEYTTMELLSVAMLIVISTFALDFIHTDRSVFKIVDLDEAWSFLQVAQGKTLSMKLVRAGRAMNAGVYFVTQNTDDLLDEKLKNNLGLKFAFRSTDINEIKKTLAFFGVDSEDENNQKRLRDLENGQCLISDLYGRVGVIQFHPIFEDLFHAFDTRPPVRKEVE